jgi:hypothetical protein
MRDRDLTFWRVQAMFGKVVLLGVIVVLAGWLLVGCSRTAQLASIPEGTCVKRASLALRDADFKQSPRVVEVGGIPTVVAEHASYWAEFRCPAKSGAAELVVTGPDDDQAVWYRDAIVRKFE